MKMVFESCISGVQSRVLRGITLAVLSMLLNGCVSSAVGLASDVAVGVVKVPYKVGKGAVGVMSGGDEDKNIRQENRQENRQESPQQINSREVR